jgi:D-glycero-alpha-D-manno-heptose-7-phosphate kinase
VLPAGRERVLVTARAWCRVDLAGGTLDIWPLGLFHPGARTVNVAIDLAATVRLRRSEDNVYRVRQGETSVEGGSASALAAQPEGALVGVVAEALDLPPVDVTLASDSPRGGGLGASSAMVVALIAAAEEALGRPASLAAERAHLARDLEARLMSLPTGIQDHYPALLGGVLEILQRPGGEAVRRVDVDLERLGDSLFVVYSGVSHFSAGNNWQVVRRRLDGEPEIMELFAGIAAAAAELPEALESGDFSRVGELMSREWSFRRRLAPGISTPELEALFTAATAAGAWGGKACGAGGGGCLAFLGPTERRGEIVGALEKAGGRVLRARPAGAPISVQLEG